MRLLTLFGVTLRLNIFFLLLFGFYWYFGVIGQALVIFSVVFLHELGHVVVALGYGLTVREVELLPFGGVAKVEGDLELNPATEILVAVAGPITNIFLALLGYSIDSLGMGDQQWLPFFINCNLTLACFNLMPAIPLDGGRIFRAVLALKIGLKKATDKAVALSRWLSILLAGAGAWSVLAGSGDYINFLVIAIFLIYFTAREKGAAMYIFMKFLARKKAELLKEGVLLIRQVAVLETAVLRDVVKYFVPKKYHLVVVIGCDHKIKGTLTEGDVIDGMMTGGSDTTAGVLLHCKK